MEAQKWAKEMMEEEETRRQAAFKERGYEEFWKPPVGTSTVEVIAGPRPITSKFGDSLVFRIKYKPKGGRLKEYDWAVNRKSYSLLRALGALLADGVMKIEITRTGEGVGTRYVVNPA